MVEHIGEIAKSSAYGFNVEQLPKGELLGLIRQVEDAVHRGTAQMRDYETFVRCQKELAKRNLP